MIGHIVPFRQLEALVWVAVRDYAEKVAHFVSDAAQIASKIADQHR